MQKHTFQSNKATLIILRFYFLRSRKHIILPRGGPMKNYILKALKWNVVINFFLASIFEREEIRTLQIAFQQII